MKGRLLILERDFQGPRAAAALVVDGRIEDLAFDPLPDDTEPPAGAVYLARVDRLVPKLGAAFVDLGGGLTGYLRDAKGVGSGVLLKVQVTGHGEPGKAIPVTRRVLYKGRTLILTPGAPGINVSRRISDAGDRDRLTAAISDATAEIDGGDDWGWIARSAAVGAGPTAIRTEVRHLAAAAGQPGQAQEGPGKVWSRAALTSALAEWTDPLPDAIIGSRATMGLLCDRLMEDAFGDQRLIDLCEDFHDGDPFDHFGVLDQIEALGSPRADLPSGGWLSIEPTSALVAVDVNTGGDFSPAAALKANLEAAREVPRQLRLRGLGGQIVIDFAPVTKKDRRRVDDALRTALRRDPVETSLAGWSALGLFELSRKRERRPLF